MPCYCCSKLAYIGCKTPQTGGRGGGGGGRGGVGGGGGGGVWLTFGVLGRQVRVGSVVDGGHGGAGQGACGEGAGLVKGNCGAPHQSVQHIATLYQDATAPTADRERSVA